MMDLDPEARRILDLAREARTPSADDKARVARRLGAALAVTAAAGSGVAAAQAAQASAAAKSVAGAVAMKWWVGGGALMAAALAGYAALQPAEAPRAPAPQAEVTTAPAAPALPAELPQPVPVAAPEPVVEAAAQAEPAESSPAPRVEPARAQARRRHGASDALAGEVELLHRAQAAWRARDARGAMALLEQHRRRHPRSALGLERDALQVLTLCELGRKADAERIARRLLARAPNSPLRASIEQSCALK